nr:micos complex subunit mic19 [Quercus suber]
MGNGGSKPEQHTFNADAPVRFSQSVIDSLQRSPDTDSTRAQQTELKIQTRVNSELQRLRDTQDKQLSELTSSLTTNPPPESDSPNSESPRDSNSLAFHLSSPFYQDHSSKKGTAETAADSGRSHDSVQKEIMDLKAKLEERKKTEKATPEVETAKEKLVQCLRTNDRRPLDCWQEVETFKAEVGKLEKAFIAKAGR